MISVESVTKTYGGGSAKVVALDDISLEIATGEIFGIIGRSGAGKTTLLRCLNLLERPTSGRIVLDGIDLVGLSDKELRPVRRKIGVVFQHFNLLHARTVESNIAFPLEVAGVPQAERRTRVAELIEIVGLGDRAKAYPSQLSGGQKQRVGIARALAARPSLLLCDEATSALDSETTGQILELLKEINESLGVTVALITHELEVVRRICHSAALLEGGRILERGTLLDLVADPGSVLGESLLPVDGTPADDGLTGVVTFTEPLASTPLLSQLTRDLSVDATLLSGGIEHIGGRAVGRVRLRFDSPAGVDPIALQKYLIDRGAQVRLSAPGQTPELPVELVTS